ncbi:hypothetical protein MUU72_04955 [Streptomyces sp. RS10V-4]|uniref:hypothetical protein n=1 Tax=Streptomyces rhizoryzae TaxID=2932493 RepID=UPI0020032C55|nr:hypothetical protein [Streptomyces rhizoryzae]MCK7622462.1 hypothetical protein [Streptomyces rhizoryzae]
MREFGLGYLVHATCAKPTDPGERPLPTSPGGSSFVVARGTGMVPSLLNHPPEQAIARSRRQQERAAGAGG